MAHRLPGSEGNYSLPDIRQLRQAYEEAYSYLQLEPARAWELASGFGIVTGTQGKNGLYFCAIDVDNPEFNLNLFRPTTHTERTPHGGYHFLYWTRENAKGVKDPNLKIELLGEEIYA
jgi:hypothetical protein